MIKNYCLVMIFIHLKVYGALRATMPGTHSEYAIVIPKEVRIDCDLLKKQTYLLLF